MILQRIQHQLHLKQNCFQHPKSTLLATIPQIKFITNCSTYLQHFCINVCLLFSKNQYFYLYFSIYNSNFDITYVFIIPLPHSKLYHQLFLCHNNLPQMFRSSYLFTLSFQSLKFDISSACLQELLFQNVSFPSAFILVFTPPKFSVISPCIFNILCLNLKHLCLYFGASL